MRLTIKATPNAKQSAIVGWEDDPLAGTVLRLRIAAPPVEGKANKEVAVFLAKKLGLPKSAVILQKGDTSRLKQFDINAAEDVVMQKIEELMSSSSK